MKKDKRSKEQKKIDKLIEEILTLDEYYFRNIIVERYKDMM